jgi:hypothetical protein
MNALSSLTKAFSKNEKAKNEQNFRSQNAQAHLGAGILPSAKSYQRQICGGKRSATPLSERVVKRAMVAGCSKKRRRRPMIGASHAAGASP